MHLEQASTRRKLRAMFLANIVRVFLGVLFLLAGILKTVDPGGYAEALATLSEIPSPLRALAFWLLPPSEIVLGVAVVISSRSRLPVVCALIALLFFCFVHGYQLHFGHPPKCSCFGTLSRYESDMLGVYASLVRNTLLISMSAGYLVLCSYARPNTERARSRLNHLSSWRSRESRLAGRAFTLVEVIVSIMIVCVLLILGAGSLRRTIQASRDVKQIASLSQAGRGLDLYCNDFRDVYPYFSREDPMTGGVYVQRIFISDQHFDSYWCWRFGLDMLGYLPGSASRSSGSPGEGWNLDTWYSATLVSHPDFWSPVTRSGPVQWQPVRSSDVMYPSRKASLVMWGDFLRMPDRSVVGITLCDGAVVRRKLRDLQRPFPDGEGSWRGAALRAGYAGMHTPDGVRGRDLIDRVGAIGIE